MNRKRSLDGLRALAFLAVFWCHCYTGQDIVSGVLGVRCFFALSGFLIAGLLLDDQRPAGEALRSFYWRRSLRIFPLYYLALAVIWGFNALPDPAWHVAYAPNLRQYLDHASNGMGHFWSLGIEEQFYLAFPLLLMAFRKRPAVAIILGIVISKAIRIGLAIHDPSYWPNLLPMVAAETLLWGALSAVIMRRVSSAIIARRWAWIAGLGALAVIGWTAGYVDIICSRVAPFATRALDGTVDGLGWSAIVLALWCAPAGAWLTRALSWKPLAGAGAISYGLYVWHLPIILGVGHFFGTLKPPVAIDWLVCLPLTFAVALASWWMIEKPALKLRDFRPRRMATPLQQAAV